MAGRWAIVIGVAAAGVMALGAQAAAAAPDVVKYDTRLTITHEGCCDKNDEVLWHGVVNSEVKKCRKGRWVILFKQRRGADRKLGATRSEIDAPTPPRAYAWGIHAPIHGRVYAKVKPKSGDGYACRADRSRILRNGEPIDPPHGL